MAPQVMGPIDYSMAALVHEHLQEQGVKLYLEQAIESFSRQGEALSVHFKSGIKLDADMVLLSIGVRAETRLAQDAHLKLGEMRGIWVNEYLQTSDENIYAVGDRHRIPTPHHRQTVAQLPRRPSQSSGTHRADNMVLGNSVRYEGSIGTAIAKVSTSR